MEIERNYDTKSLSYHNEINGDTGGLNKPALIPQ
jgi:hypothetical protein